jgi:hypothetical protein
MPDGFANGLFTDIELIFRESRQKPGDIFITDSGDDIDVLGHSRLSICHCRHRSCYKIGDLKFSKIPAILTRSS